MMPTESQHDKVFSLALGSNIGDSQLMLQRVLIELAADENLVLDKVSQVYRTPPFGYHDQPDFLNMAVSGKSSLDPEALLTLVKLIEKKLGRKKTFRWGPREIDIDIITYGYERYQSDALTIPHPNAHERAFVLVPLLEVLQPEIADHFGFGQALALMSDSDKAEITRASATIRMDE